MSIILYKKCPKCGFTELKREMECCPNCGNTDIKIEINSSLEKQRTINENTIKQEEKSKKRNKGKSIIDLPCDYTLIDIETTGLIPAYDEIIELSAIKVRDNEIIDKYSTLVKPEYEVDEFITELTGITNEMLLNSPNIKDVLEQFINFIGDDIVVGYNVNFDINFIYDDYKGYFNKDFSNNYVDLMRICKKHCILPNYELKTVSEFYNISTQGHHRGLNDCYIEFELYNKVSAEIIEKYVCIKDFYNQNWYQCKTAKDITTSNTSFNEDNFFFNKVCVFTGILDIPRKEAMQKIVDVGGKVSDTLNRETNVLIVGTQDCLKTKENGKSNKMLKAEKYILKGQDLQIISENDFMELIEE